MKISDRAVALWTALLAAVPNARLLLKFVFLGSPEVQADLRQRFADAGADVERLILKPPADPFSEHLNGYRDVDIALDTTPYNGTTTTCEALWMGVPVITLAGRNHAARVGASLLTAAGLPELIAEDEADYIRRAAALAADPSRIGTYRTTLRDRLQDSPLLDAADFARHMETTLRKIWRDRCADETRP